MTSPPVFQSSLSLCHGRNMATSTDAAAHLIRALRSGAPPAFATPLARKPTLAAPASLHNYKRRILNAGLVAGARDVLTEVKSHDAFAAVDHVISGGTDFVCGLKDPEMNAFVVDLFRTIQESAPVDVQLSTWDLYHGHLFLHMPLQSSAAAVAAVATEGGSNAVAASSSSSTSPTFSDDGRHERGEVGILFHAKEFPAEFTNSAKNFRPVGHPSMGGSKDPRTGTCCSVHDDDYHVRNYLWLLSTNTIVVLDPNHEAFPKRGLMQHGASGVIFKSVAAFAFGLYLGDVNYFPTECGEDVLAILARSRLHHAEPADRCLYTLHLLDSIGIINGEGSGEEATSEAKTEVKAEAKGGDEVIECGDGASVAHIEGAVQELVARFMSPPEVRVVLNVVESALAAARDGDRDDTAFVEETAAGACNNAGAYSAASAAATVVLERVVIAARARLLEMRVDQEQRAKTQFDRELRKLMSSLPSATAAHATEALERMKNMRRLERGGDAYSAFRAESLLATAFPAYRANLMASQHRRVSTAKGGIASTTCPHIATLGCCNAVGGGDGERETDSARVRGSEGREGGEGIGGMGAGMSDGEGNAGETGIALGGVVCEGKSGDAISSEGAVMSFAINVEAPCATCTAAAMDKSDEATAAAELALILPPEMREMMICLHCGEVFCGRYIAAHAVAHHAATGHSVVMGAQNLSVWCYECDTNVDTRLPELEGFHSEALRQWMDVAPECDLVRRATPPWATAGPYTIDRSFKALQGVHHSCFRADLALEALLQADELCAGGSMGEGSGIESSNGSSASVGGGGGRWKTSHGALLPQVDDTVLARAIAMTRERYEERVDKGDAQAVAQFATAMGRGDSQGSLSE